jgi:hypothetical protein
MENEINARSPNSVSSIIADINFHKTLVDANNNSYFQQLIIFLDENFRIKIKKGNANSAKINNISEKVLKEHTCIYKDIVKKDITVANSAIRRHVFNSASRLNLTVELIMLKINIFFTDRNPSYSRVFGAQQGQIQKGCKTCWRAGSVAAVIYSSKTLDCAQAHTLR